VRIAVDHVRVQADDPQQLAHALLALRMRASVEVLQRLGHDRPDGHARVERRVRVLKDHLDPPPERMQLGRAEPSDILSVEDDAASRRRVQAYDRLGERRLAAAGFTDQSERLTALDAERHAVDRANVANGAAKQPGVDGEVLDHIIEFEQFAVGRTDHQSGPGKKHAAR
jgi:hypothetical protein